jgi:hypothetical protein
LNTGLGHKEIRKLNDISDPSLYLFPLNFDQTLRSDT